ncbi:MAG: alkaline phosphatase family protein [Asticcacaulis sp.]
MFRSFAAGLALLLLAGCAGLQREDIAGAPPEHPLILISIDAFRPDYLDRGLTPHLQALSEGGVHAVMHPSFPSLTFPNHYTLVTGRRPDNNGLVANAFRDPRRPDEIFSTSKPDITNDRFWWDEATPFWVSAEEAGKHVGVEFWPGSQADPQGVRPAYFTPYDKKVTSAARVDQVLAWMDLPPEQRPTAYALYFDAVDEAGHANGPERSAALDAAMIDVDTAIGRLLDGVKARGVVPNIVLVSDHGMAAISADRVYYLEDLLPPGSYEPIYTSSVALIEPVAGHEDEVDKALIGTHRDHMQCWHRGDIPARLHYGQNPRVARIFCLADLGWLISTTHQRGPGYVAGAHGYDPAFPEMNAIFIANGPAFKAGVELAPFDNVDVYDLEMQLLHLRPEPNDGQLAPLRPALK